MGEKSKVYIVCCNRLLRESIARILSKKPDFNVLAAQAPSSTSRDEIIESGADALVLDSLEFLLESPIAAGNVCALGRALRCVLVAMEDDHSRFLRAIRCGARGYVLQDASAVDVVSAIRTVVDGEAVCPPHYARVLFDCIARQTVDPTDRRPTQWGLTRRERQLVPLIGKGLSNKEIASQLSLSEQTVKNHIHRMLQKVGVPDRLSVFEACRSELSAANTKDGGYVV